MAKQFREIRRDESFPQIEERMLDLWDRDGSFARSLRPQATIGTNAVHSNGAESVPFTFYDGPPFATGLPHYGHLLAGTIKDIVPRYWTMKGRRVPRRFGWDCHGLPIESLIQNELKLSGVAEIKAFGEDNFNEACRGTVLKYTSEWRRTVRRMGRWVDFDNDYKTMDASFMESVWWVFQQCWNKGLIYQGYRIQPYSPALATPLSNFETNQGYKDRQDPSITLLFPLVQGARRSDGSAEPLADRFVGTSLLVWTTTPWTLPSNLAIAVGADIEYVLVEVPAGAPAAAGQKVWLAESRLPAYFPTKKGSEPVVVLDHCRGSELAGLGYQPLFTYADVTATVEQLAKRYVVYTADFVSTEDGAGAVHIAPSFGEEDFQLGASLGLGMFDPLDVEGRFTDMVPDWKGIGAKDADKAIIHSLKEKGRVFKHDTLVHSYPHCYRTGVPLLYRALKTWFLALDKEITSADGQTKTLKQWMIDCNQQINWVPDHIKDGRFGKWLDNARDWNISRNRFWGTPLPVWIEEIPEGSTQEPEMLCVGSIAELEALSGTKLSDLHKHFVDPVIIVKDGRTFRRTSEVFDCWFESGSMPYAQSHYPFENSETWAKGFPADFIAEGLDQTRGWFYTLTVLAAALFQKPAFKNVIVNGIILAEDGTKMSKSKRNYPDPNDLIGRTGADAVRLFMINSAALKAEDLRFSEEGVKQIVKSVMLPLWNAVGFFVSNHNADAAKGQLTWTPSDAWQSDNELDRWIVAVLQQLASKVETEMEGYRLYAVVPSIVAFVDDLTNWYVRRSRRRFWKSDNDGDKNSAYATLYKVLVDFSRILAPFLPFLAEEIFQILVREVQSTDSSLLTHHSSLSALSVHLTEFPSADASLTDDALVQRMAMVRGVVEMGRSIRAACEIKNRQPLGTLTLVPHGPDEKAVAESMRDLILEELNVQTMVFLDDETSLVSLSAKPNFAGIKAKGPEYAKNMKEITTRLTALDVDAIRNLQAGGALTLTVADGSVLQVGADCLLIARNVPEGVAVEADNHYTLALDLHISPELKRGCMARELVNRIQTRRKELDLEITTRIALQLGTDSEQLVLAIAENRDYIMGETQANSLEVVQSEVLEKSNPELVVQTDADGEPLGLVVLA